MPLCLAEGLSGAPVLTLCITLASSPQRLCSNTAWLLNPFQRYSFSPVWLLLWVYFWIEKKLKAYFRVDVITLFRGLPICCGLTGSWKKQRQRRKNKKDSISSIIKTRFQGESLLWGDVFLTVPCLPWPAIPGWLCLALRSIRGVDVLLCFISAQVESAPHVLRGHHGGGQAQSTREPPLAARLRHGAASSAFQSLPRGIKSWSCLGQI